MCLAVICFLAAVLLASLSGGKDKRSRAVCMSNLKQIGLGMAVYANDHADRVIEAKRNNTAGLGLTNSFVQVALEPEAAKAAATAYLDVDTTNHSVWSCPDIPQLPQNFLTSANGPGGQWAIGYQYFGGITNWCNPAFFAGVPSRSPVTFSESQPTWVLAADAILKIQGAWGTVPNVGNGRAFENMPPHRQPKSTLPTGGNELLMDGSVHWYPFEKMYFLTTWQSLWGQRQAFFYQDTNDFDPALLAQLPSLAAPTFK